MEVGIRRYSVNRVELFISPVDYPNDHQFMIGPLTKVMMASHPYHVRRGVEAISRSGFPKTGGNAANQVA